MSDNRTPIQFIRDMLQEKGIYTDRQLLTEQHSGLTIETLLQFIEQMSEPTQKQVRDMFSKIDLHNGDLMDYIVFLAKGMVESIEKAGGSKIMAFV